MAKKGIKIEDLARELGLTSRQLITRCREGGLPVQNSVTKLNHQSERQVRGWFDRNSSNSDSPMEDVDAEPT